MELLLGSYADMLVSSVGNNSYRHEHVHACCWCVGSHESNAENKLIGEHDAHAGVSTHMFGRSH
eukprot:3829380-Amphidinium_carterae.1